MSRQMVAYFDLTCDNCGTTHRSEHGAERPAGWVTFYGPSLVNDIPEDSLHDACSPDCARALVEADLAAILAEQP